MAFTSPSGRCSGGINMRGFLVPFCSVVLLLAPVAPALAQDELQPPVESSKVVGPYEILYSVMPTTFISEKVAASYKIVRGKDQALINVSIRKKEGAGDVAQAGSVSGKYSDLMQSKKLQFREIREQDAIYYIAGFRHADKEMLRFDLNVVPDPGMPAQTITFTRKLFIDE
jgi:hypothetical protein